MSAQAVARPPSSSPRSDQLTKPAPRRRTIRLIAKLALLFVLAIVLAGGVLLYSPPVLETLSAIPLKPKPGTIPWNGRDRITIAAMGLTQRTTEPARTDTLLVMDIDPSKHRINMLSVPRDLWVNIPGYGQGKLAIAYEVGGPKLAAYTLERELGIPVDYSMALTFRGFTQIIDAMGGVTVDVPRELKDESYPCLTGYNYCPIDIKPGRQHMDGATALEFVRERHAFAQQDLARVQDQQAFSTAVKHTLLSPLTWPRYPAILGAFQRNLITNLPLNDLPEIGVQYGMPTTDVNHSYINADNGMVRDETSADGQSILVPTSSSVIPNLVHRLFSDPTLAQEHASVAILNGTTSSGVATDAQSTLQGLGFNTVSAGNADSTAYAKTEVIENSGVGGSRSYTSRRLQRILNARLVHRDVPGQTAQIVIILGRDFPGA